MRYRVLRFDIWLCLLLSVLLAMGAEKALSPIINKKHESHKEKHTAEINEVGGVADETVFRAQSVEDLLSHDTFTVISPGIEYRNKGAGYYKNMYLQALTLPSGEKVAALINEESVIHAGDSIYTNDSTLPVGRIVKEDLTKEETFLSQIEYKEKLSRTDFYIDMAGNTLVVSEESFAETHILLVQCAVVVIAFPIFHTIGSKLGIFPYFFAPKKKKKSEWE